MEGLVLNLLNQKIRAVKHTIVRLKQMEALTPNSGERVRIRENIDDLNVILVELLEQAGDS